MVAALVGVASSVAALAPSPQCCACLLDTRATTSGFTAATALATFCAQAPPADAGELEARCDDRPGYGLACIDAIPGTSCIAE
jgi:hypothetical protein